MANSKESPWQLFTALRYDPALLELPLKFGNPQSLGWNRKQSPYYMLDYHRDRMLRAAKHWGWQSAVEKLDGDGGLQNLEAFLDDSLKGQTEPHRVRVILEQQGIMSCEIPAVPPVHLQNLFPYALPRPGTHADVVDDGSPVKEPEYEIMIDSEVTEGTEFTHYKTTNRFMYNDARSRARLSLQDKKEVLLLNRVDGSIMEGSTTTPYFWRGGRWVTPPVSPSYAKDQGSGGNDGTTRRWALGRGLAVEEVVLATSLVDGEECWLSNGVRGFIFGRVMLHPF